jgi:flagellar biosynthesis component FlhA
MAEEFTLPAMKELGFTISKTGFASARKHARTFGPGAPCLVTNQYTKRKGTLLPSSSSSFSSYSSLFPLPSSLFPLPSLQTLFVSYMKKAGKVEEQKEKQKERQKEKQKQKQRQNKKNNDK